MGKKQKRLKEGMDSLGGAYLRALVALAEQRTRHDATIDAMAWQIKQLTEERDAAREDVQELLRDNEAADSTIRDLRKGLEVLGGVADMFERDLAAVKAQYYTVSEALDLELEYSAKTIGELRERLDAALTDAARMRKEWANDASVAREIIARKTDENIKLRRDSADTISDLRGDLAKVRGDLERVTESWQHAEDLLQERERELNALQAEVAEWQAVD